MLYLAAVRSKGFFVCYVYFFFIFSRCKFLHGEQRMRISENEFWLIDWTNGVVRIEVFFDNFLGVVNLEA